MARLPAVMRAHARRRAPPWLAVVAVAIGCLAPGPESSAAAVPEGFDDQHVTTLPRPTAMAFTPDERLLIAGKAGALRVYEDGALLPTAALDLIDRVCSDSERGLLGIAVDPEFGANRFIYLYYTFNKFGVCDRNTPTAPVNRISRFVLGDDDLVDPVSEVVLVDNIPSPDGIHNAGDLGFGKDGYLYASVGDGGCDFRGDSGCSLLNDAARDLGGLNGKLLRITRDGGIPPGNPFTGGGTVRCNLTGQTPQSKRCREIYAYGLRNPFRFSFDPVAPQTRMHINDVGTRTWEELDLAAAGADYGWNVREGHCAADSLTNCGPPPAGMTNPIYDYGHDEGCTSMTLSATVPEGIWPVEYDGAYLYGDSTCRKIFRLDPAEGGGFTAVEIMNATGSVIDGIFGPYGDTQALYYFDWRAFPNDQVRRLAFTGQQNRAPTAQAAADPGHGDLPLVVSLDGTASSDPDDDPLSYEWDFGDGSPPETTAIATHTYTTQGTFAATLRVDDGRGGVDTTSVRIDAGNNPPAPAISSPASSHRFYVEESIMLDGSAMDPEDGALPATALTWEVIRHHDTHTHPFLPPTSGTGIQITAPTPEDIYGTTTSYLEIMLTATDSRGLSRTVSQELRPRLVDLMFDTAPPGLGLEVAGSSIVAPATVTSWEGWQVPVNAPDQVDSSGQGVTFVSWSDGGTRTHEVATPQAPATHTATFTQRYARPKGATPTRLSLALAYRACTQPNRTHGEPLAYGSCAPPQLASDHLTVGTPDANGEPASSVGFAHLRVLPGDPATIEDEADVALELSIGDVRVSPSLEDYSGELSPSVQLRVTDGYNGASSTDAATMTDWPLRLTVPCAATPDPSVGSTCSTSTSADSLLPGIAVEGSRAIWELGKLELFDGGADGDGDTTADNTLFATQGLFVP